MIIILLSICFLHCNMHAILLSQTPFPQKWVWMVGFGIISLHGVCNILYQVGGKFIILMPVLSPLQAAVETTATLALVVGAYSARNRDLISSHWYSLPTGCTPIAMLGQYFPTYYVQCGFIVIFLAYVIVKDRAGMAWALPFGLMLGSTAVKVLGVAIPGVLTSDDLGCALLAVSTFLMICLSTGTSRSVTFGNIKFKLG